MWLSVNGIQSFVDCVRLKSSLCCFWDAQNNLQCITQPTQSKDCSIVNTQQILARRSNSGTCALQRSLSLALQAWWMAERPWHTLSKQPRAQLVIDQKNSCDVYRYGCIMYPCMTFLHFVAVLRRSPNNLCDPGNSCYLYRRLMRHCCSAAGLWMKIGLLLT